MSRSLRVVSIHGGRPPPPAKEAPGRFRKIEVRMWGDDKFCALSPLQPSGQALWVYLLTGPHTGSLPGLFRIGPLAICEELGWDLEPFAKAFDELLESGMLQADRKARLMYLPNAIRHNPPANPNVVKGWSREFDVLPDCELKWNAFDGLKASIYALGKSFAEGFDASFGRLQPKPFTKGFGKEWGETGAVAVAVAEAEAGAVEDLSTPAGVEVQKPDPVSLPAPPPDEKSTELNGQHVLPEVEPPTPVPWKPPPCPHKELIAAYHAALPTCRRVREWTDNHAATLQARWREKAGELRWSTQHEGIEWFRAWFAYVARSDFLTGKAAPGRGRSTPFIASLSWLVKHENFAKVIEGAYE